MPQYLDHHNDNLYAIDQLGSTFSRAAQQRGARGMAEQQFAAQMALHFAQLKMEQQKAIQAQLHYADQNTIAKQRADAAGLQYTARANFDNARTAKMSEMAKSGGVMADATQGLYDVNPETNPDTDQFLRGIIAREAMRQAATNPQNIGMQSAQIAQARDPRMQRVISTRGQSFQNVPAGGAVIDMTTGRPVFQGRPTGSGESSDDRFNRELALRQFQAEVTPQQFGDPPDIAGAIRRAQGTRHPTNVLTATHKHTGQKIMSRDGGATWEPVGDTSNSEPMNATIQAPRVSY